MPLQKEEKTFTGEASRPLKVDSSHLKIGKSYSIIGGYLYIEDDHQSLSDYGIAKMKLVDGSGAV